MSGRRSKPNQETLGDSSKTEKETHLGRKLPKKGQQKKPPDQSIEENKDHANKTKKSDVKNESGKV